jgi:hypothetical protein
MALMIRYFHSQNLLTPVTDEDGSEPWNKWLSGNGASTAWIQQTLQETLHIVGYSLASANDCPERDPTSWELLGKVAGSDEWESLHSIDVGEVVRTDRTTPRCVDTQ